MGVSLDSVGPDDPVPFTEIALERSNGLAPSPAFFVVFGHSGSVEYTGHRFVEFEGDRKGVMDRRYFVILSNRADELGLADLEQWGVPQIDGESVTLHFAARDTFTTQVKRWGGEPIEFRQFAQEMETLLLSVRWTSEQSR